MILRESSFSSEDSIEIFILINSDNLLLLFLKMQTVRYQIQYNTTIPKGYNLYNNNNSTFISPIYTFLWRETTSFTRQIKVQIGRSTLIKLSMKGKKPNLAGNKHLSVHFFLH